VKCASKYIFYFFGIIILFFLIVIILSSCDNKQLRGNKNIERKIETETKPEQDKDSVYAVTMVGDIMMGTNYPSSYSLPPDDGKYLFDDVKEYLELSDVTIGNLEGTLLDKGGTPKVCRDSSDNCVSFRMPTHYAAYLKGAGFDIMSVANNHSGDMGDIGRKSTMSTLDEYKIKYAGYTSCPTAIFIKDGIKFGFTAFAPNTGTQDLLNITAAEKTIKELRLKCDILIVYFHGGAEGSGASRVPRKTEYYLGEVRGNVYEFAHSMIDAGADIVFGSGPHVPRGIELYNDKIIAYSLGNFCTYSKFGLSGVLGYAPILKVYIDKEGNFRQGRIFPAIQIKRGFPVIDENYKVVEFIRSLNEKDFPESELEISDDGKITKKK
jgi:capsule synthesis protein PGA_cap